MSETVPIQLTQSNLDAVAELLGRAFVNDPVTVYMYPDASTRPRRFAQTSQCVLRYGLHCGELQATSANLEGVALWFPPGEIDASFWTQLRFGFLALPFSIGIQSFRRLLAYVDHAAKLRARHLRGPHWYLQFLAVDPAHQGVGHSGVLLRSMLARLDREGVPCCLDTENEKNVAMYEHFGFRVRESSKIPGSSCDCWLLSREVNCGKSM